MYVILDLIVLFSSGVKCDDFNVWIGASFTTDWAWENSGLLLSATYARWAAGEPAATTGHLYMSHIDDFAYAVALGTEIYHNYMCEAAEVNSSCPATFGGPISGSCYRLGWTSTGANWSDTQAACRELSAELLELETESEYIFIKNWLKTTAPTLAPKTTTSLDETTEWTVGEWSSSTGVQGRVADAQSARSFTSKMVTTSTEESGQQPSYVYVVCYTTPIPITAGVTEEGQGTGSGRDVTRAPGPAVRGDVDDFDPSTHPDMAIVPASIGLTAMVALAIFLIGIVILDVGALKRDTRKLIRNVRHACRRAKSGRVHAEKPPRGEVRVILNRRRPPERDKILDKP